MSDVSQGPGWWQASDGKWYPPRWEYRWAAGWCGPKASRDLLDDALIEGGRQGWEAVAIDGAPPTFGQKWVSVLMKRPLLS